MDLRLFIAVELPEDWLAALARVQEALRKAGLDALRWTRPEGIHLTLKFLGEVPEERLEEIRRAMTRAAAQAQPFALRLGQLGAFGAPQRPRVLWAGIAGDLEALTHLWRALEAEITPLGFPQERNAFAPHLTLARVPEHAQRDMAKALAEVLPRIALPELSPLDVGEIALMRSLLGPGGARYQRLAAAPLARNSP
jgi:2'-5' RNA ligase